MLRSIVGEYGRGTPQQLDAVMKGRYEEARRAQAAGERVLWIAPVDRWPESYFRHDVDEIRLRAPSASPGSSG